MLDIDLVKNHARKIVESGQEHDFIVLIEGARGVTMITHVYRNSKFYMESAEILDTPQGHKLGKFEAIDNAEGRMLVKEW